MLLTAMMMTASLASTAFASPLENTDTPSVTVTSEPSSEELSFDLTKHVKQEQTVIVNGQECTIGIEPVGTTPRGIYDLSDGQWKIYWYAAAINARYYIDIVDGEIVDAYDPYVLTMGYTLVSDELSFTSKKSSYELRADMKVSDLGFSYGAGLYAQILSNNKLNTYFR